MKQLLTGGIRKLLPSGAVCRVEEGYRKARARTVTFRYGHPAKHLKVIAVTGTNGKTTTVNFLNEILKEAGYKTAMFSTATIEIAGDDRAYAAVLPCREEGSCRFRRDGVPESRHPPA